MASWKQRIRALFDLKKVDNTQLTKKYEYEMRHPHVRLIWYEVSGKSRFNCSYHHDFIDDFDTIKNTHWGCPECNIVKKQQLIPYVPNVAINPIEVRLTWYWQRRAQREDKKDNMAKLCDAIEQANAPLKVLSYRVLPSELQQGKWDFELTIECAIDGILRTRLPEFSVDSLPKVMCPVCKKRWTGQLSKKITFPIK